MGMKLSNDGIDFIVGWEGLKLGPYKAPEQIGTNRYTVGVGSTYIPMDVEVDFIFGKVKYDEDMPIQEHHMLKDEAAAKHLFANTVNIYEACVNHGADVPLKQNQFDALVSLCFNIGCHAFLHSTLLYKLNEKNYAGACAEFARWDNMGSQELKGLENRRVAEIALFAKEMNG